MSCGSVRVRRTARTGNSGDGDSRRPGVPGAAFASAGSFGRAGRNWWRAWTSIACPGPRPAPRVRRGVSQGGGPARERDSAEVQRSASGLRIASARCDGSLLPLASETASAAPAGARHSRASQSADRPRGRLRRAAAAWLLACAALLALPALPGQGGGVAHADVLVSNLGQTANSETASVRRDFPRAQAFTTGSNTAGYTLDSVGVSLKVTPPTASYFSVSIHESSGGDPGDRRYTLSNPSTFATGANVFTAPAKAFLEGGTPYFVVVKYNNPTSSSEETLLLIAASDSEDAAGEDDWSIANSSEFLLSGSWMTRTDSLKIRVNGLARAAITDIDIETEPTAIGSFSGFHGTGDFIQVRVTFSRDVLGTPEASVASLKLLVGGKERTAQAQFTQLPLRSFVFVYTIQADDVDLDGITVPADALALPQGGALQDTDGVDAVLRHAAFDFPEDIVNPPLPEITNIEVSSPVPDAGFHSSALLDPVEFRVTFSDAVTVTGAQAFFFVRVGGDDVGATYSLQGSGTTQLTFELGYGPQHTDADGVSVPAGSLTLSGGTTVKGPYGRDVTLTHGAYAFPQHFVNTLPPAPHITNIEVSSPVPDAGFHSSALLDPVEFRVTFSDAVTVTGAQAFFFVRVGGDDVGATYSLQGSGTTQLTFELGYGPQHTDADGVSVPAGSLTLSGGTTVKGPYDRDVTLTHGAYAFPQHRVNTPPPPAHLTGIEVASSPGSGGFYATGDTIELHVTFSGPVTAAGSAPGTPPDVALKLRVGSAERSAEYLLGSGTSKLRFLYTVQAGDEDRDGVSVPANALALGTGMTLKDRFGQDVVSTHGAYGPFARHLVNSAPPPRGITGIDIVSPAPDAGFYATGDTIELHVTFSGAVTAAGNAPGTPPGRRARAAGRQCR